MGTMGEETEYIKLKVVSQDSNEIRFRVKSEKDSTISTTLK